MSLCARDDPPEELTQRRQWVAWRWEEREDKPTKPPLNPHSGAYASTTNSATWGTYDEARRFVEDQRPAAGIGFVFTKDDPYAGIDLDGCVDPSTGLIAPWAEAVIDYVGSYSEVSPSGTGVKIFARGTLRAGLHRGSIEMYDCGRYFTVTRQHVRGTPAALEQRGDQISVLYAWLAGHDPEAGQPALRPGHEEDAEIVRRALRATNGAQFERLWQGDWSGYPSQSEADLALCSHLVFWTGGDADRTDRLFRQSGLCRDKWDEPHFADGRTYGAATIDKAISGSLKGGERWSVSSPPPPGSPADNGQAPRRGARFALTDSGNAELLAGLYGNRLRYDHRRRRWLLWSGHWWEADADAEVLRLAKAAARYRYRAAAEIDDLREREAEARWAISSESRMRLDAALNLARAERSIADAGDDWDANPWLCNDQLRAYPREGRCP